MPGICGREGPYYTAIERCNKGTLGRHTPILGLKKGKEYAKGRAVDERQQVVV